MLDKVANIFVILLILNGILIFILELICFYIDKFIEKPYFRTLQDFHWN